jgi:hypothetical protein
VLGRDRISNVRASDAEELRLGERVIGPLDHVRRGFWHIWIFRTRPDDRIARSGLRPGYAVVDYEANTWSFTDKVA